MTTKHAAHRTLSLWRRPSRTGNSNGFPHKVYEEDREGLRHKECDNVVSFSRKLSDYVVNLAFDRLPEAVILQAKRCILDTLGCMLFGSRPREGGIVAEVVADSYGNGKSSLI